ncbi:MAG: SAM-dependent methyltransferase [bacterium]|nr:MAG: SAM-dependent methyltransferase [bacterium]
MDYDYTKKVYRAWSGVYDFTFKNLFYPRQSYAISSMNISPGEKVLDVGIGTGMALSCYPGDCEVTGIDLSASMLKKAEVKVAKYGLDNVKLREMDACNLNFEDNTFDHVIATFLISVVPDPVRALSEMKRVCKKDRPVVLVNHFMSSNKMVAWLEKTFDPVCRKIGWRNTLNLAELMGAVNLQVDSCTRMKKFDLWSIVFATNTK